MEYINKKKNISIVANSIEIRNNVTLKENINIKLKGDFYIGDNSVLGSNTEILGNNVIIGKHLFNSSGLRVGGGGRQYPNANLSIGDRCVIHNNFINVCEPVIIGNDVGLSPDTSILTHGYWQSVLEGYPYSFSGVTIGNGVIVGYRSLIMMGVSIVDNVVIGAQSVVTKSIKEKGIYAGSPARFIKEITPLSLEDKIKKVEAIIKNYEPISIYHNIKSKIVLDYPKIKVDDFMLDCEDFSYSGEETIATDNFRDYIRKYGIRIYTYRGFKNNFSL